MTARPASVHSHYSTECTVDNENRLTTGDVLTTSEVLTTSDMLTTGDVLVDVLLSSGLAQQVEELVTVIVEKVPEQYDRLFE